jgi:thioredoxin-related protein
MSLAQENSFHVYDPDLDGKVQISESLNSINGKDKHLLVMIGGNWCKWCRMFDKFSHENPKIDSTLSRNFEVVHINYSKTEPDEELFEELGFPQRFGFPVFVIMDSEGTRLHTQNTVYLEEGNGYSEKRVLNFLNNWSPEVLKADNYKKNK